MAESAPAVTRVLAWVALSAACASTPPSSLVPTDLLIAMQVADELERDRHFALAREQLIAAAECADTAEHADSLRLRACELWTRQGDLTRARACYEQTELSGGDESRALLMHRMATIDLEQGDAEGARTGMLDVVRTYPGTDAAKRALRSARALANEEGGVPAEVELLEAVAALVGAGAVEGPARDLYLEAVVGAAQRRLEALGDPGGAEELLRPVLEGGASTWLDDALIWRARALARLGEYEEALALYQRLIDDRESSWFVGSYDSVFLDDAWFERALVLERAGRHDAAREAFETMIDEVPDSRLVDDAAFRAARLVGDPAALERFIADYPDSRHAREARELLGTP